MTAPLSLPGTERGVTRVYAVNLPWDDATRTDGATLLGVPDLPEGCATLIALPDLADIGLRGYLIDGLGLPSDQILRDKAKLAALDGHVVVLTTDALQGRAVTLTPGARLTLIGTYHDAPPPPPDFTPLTSDAAHGTLSGPGGPASQPRRGYAAWVIAALAVIAVLALALLIGAA